MNNLVKHGYYQPKHHDDHSLMQQSVGQKFACEQAQWQNFVVVVGAVWPRKPAQQLQETGLR